LTEQDSPRPRLVLRQRTMGGIPIWAIEKV
jgi:hypothetical protein